MIALFYSSKSSAGTTYIYLCGLESTFYWLHSDSSKDFSKGRYTSLRLAAALPLIEFVTWVFCTTALGWLAGLFPRISLTVFKDCT